ncbi:TraI domain-containing protein [Cupriavidus pauculus]|uniref:TraI domain-containing protein n=1 Tax=Cupriavidus pauculus TaxID=82633 RepID=UPI001EE275E7|nr:TraI domain-containing protein [Cupriavidus pauculus]GJG97767.1 type VI secretion protein [Cupriavidus pauculus]
MTYRLQMTSELLATHANHIQQVAQFANEPDYQAFARKWLKVLEDCAHWFSSVPLQPDGHTEPGGAFRATIETVHTASRLASAYKFAADLPSERRRRLEPQYHYALFLAACCTWLDEPWRHFIFRFYGSDAPWSPMVHAGVGEWLGDTTFTVERRASPVPTDRLRAGLLARDILTPARMRTLDEEVAAALLGCLDPTPVPTGKATLLQKIIRKAMDMVTQREAMATRAVFQPGTLAVSGVSVACARLEVAQGVTANDAVDAADAADADTAKSVQGSASPATSALPACTQPQGVRTNDPQGSKKGSHEAPRGTVPDGSAPIETPLALPKASARKRPAAPAEPAAPKAPMAQDGGPADGSATPGEGSLADRVRMLLPNADAAQEFLVALLEDVAAGKAKYSLSGNHLTLSKRTMGGYGLSSEAVIGTLREAELVHDVVGQDVVLDARIASLLNLPQASATSPASATAPSRPVGSASRDPLDAPDSLDSMDDAAS